MPPGAANVSRRLRRSSDHWRAKARGRARNSDAAADDDDDTDTADDDDVDDPPLPPVDRQSTSSDRRTDEAFCN